MHQELWGCAWWLQTYCNTWLTCQRDSTNRFLRNLIQHHFTGVALIKYGLDFKSLLPEISSVGKAGRNRIHKEKKDNDDLVCKH